MTPDELYRLPLEEFTAARDAAAKAAKAEGDVEHAKQLKALRRPSVSAWLVNLLVGEQPELVEQLLELGPALAQAQAQGQGDELRSLGAQRRELVDAVTQQATGLAGRPATSAVRAEVASTLETALADPEAAEAVRSGRLVRALSYAGFGGVDLAGAVATTAPRPKRPKKADDDRPERVAAAEAAALEAAGRLDDAVRECERRERERRQAEERATQAEQQVEQARQALDAAEREAAGAGTAHQAAARAADEAVQAVRAAQQAEELARADLDRLRRG